MEKFKVSIHRDLIFAKFDTLDLYEQRILYSALSKIEPPIFAIVDGKKVINNPIKQLEPIVFTIRDFKNLLDKSELKYETLRKMGNSITKKSIGFERERNGKKDFDFMPWLSRMSYFGHEGIIEIVINPELYPYVLNLDGNFTTVDLKTLFQFKSKYTSRFYYLFETNLFRKSFKITLEHLKVLTGTSGMNRYYHFKQRVLEPSLKDIKENTNYEIEYKEIKVGQANKVVEIEFNIKVNKKAESNKNIDMIPPLEKLIEEMNLTEKGYSYKFVQSLSEKLKPFKEQVNLSEELCYLIDYTEQATGITKPEGFILSIIKTALESNLNSFKAVLKSKAPKTKESKEIVPGWFNNKDEDTPKVEYAPIQYQGEIISFLDMNHLERIKLLYDLDGLNFLLSERTDVDMKEVNRINDLYGIENVLNDNKI